jgi:hypothetical protein
VYLKIAVNLFAAAAILGAAVYLGTRDCGSQLPALHGDLKALREGLRLEHHQRVLSAKQAEKFVSDLASRGIATERRVQRGDLRLERLESIVAMLTAKGGVEDSAVPKPAPQVRFEDLSPALQSAIAGYMDENFTLEGLVEWNVQTLSNHLGNLVSLPQEPGVRETITRELSIALREAQTRLDAAQFAWQSELQRAVDRMQQSGEYTEVGPDDSIPLPPTVAGKYISHVRSPASGNTKQVFFLTEASSPTLFDQSVEREIVTQLFAESVGIAQFHGTR